LASVAGLGLGTVQASSRVFFTQFIPVDHESGCLGMYSLAGKSSAIMGPRFSALFLRSLEVSGRPYSRC
jgi:UMF1 family MFS transporter